MKQMTSPNFFDVANSAYENICEIRNAKREYYLHSQRKVSEIDFDDLSSGEIEELSNKFKNWKPKSAKCFNCHSEEHLLKQCPKEISRIFCFKCGMEGVYTPKCSKCNSNLNYNRSVN